MGKEVGMDMGMEREMEASEEEEEALEEEVVEEGDEEMGEEDRVIHLGVVLVCKEGQEAWSTPSLRPPRTAPCPPP